MADHLLTELSSLIRERRYSSSETSYTRSLLEKGIDRCAQKFGEEAIETIIAAVHESEEKLKCEAADLLFHLLVLLEARSLGITDVLDVLRERKGISGLDEKASRTK